MASSDPPSSRDSQDDTVRRSRSGSCFGNKGAWENHTTRARGARWGSGSPDIGPPSPQDQARSKPDLARRFRAKNPDRTVISSVFKAGGTRQGPTPLPQFRTIQVGPKDLPAALRQAELAEKRPQRMSRKSGNRFSDKDMRKKGGRGHFWEAANHVFDMRRREFIVALGGAAAASPLAARAVLASEASGQRGDSKVQQPAMPVVGL